eukprot:Skav212213  [mRNA]  locus=scaffold754:1038428:1039663:+ [translate_table: standard]
MYTALWPNLPQWLWQNHCQLGSERNDLWTFGLKEEGSMQDTKLQPTRINTTDLQTVFEELTASCGAEIAHLESAKCIAGMRCGQADPSGCQEM